MKRRIRETLLDVLIVVAVGLAMALEYDAAMRKENIND